MTRAVVWRNKVNNGERRGESERKVGCRVLQKTPHTSAGTCRLNHARERQTLTHRQTTQAQWPKLIDHDDDAYNIRSNNMMYVVYWAPVRWSIDELVGTPRHSFCESLTGIGKTLSLSFSPRNRNHTFFKDIASLSCGLHTPRRRRRHGCLSDTKKHTNHGA